MILLPLLLILLMMHHNHIVHSEHCSEEVEFVTAVSDIVSESVLIVFNENSNKGETINREVDMIKYEIETVEEIIEKDLSSMEVNSDDEHSSAMSLSSAGALPHSTLLVIIIVPVVSVILIIFIVLMFCLYWRRKKAVRGISEKKIREKLEKFKQRKLESQREISISTISNDAGGGDYEEIHHVTRVYSRAFHSVQMWQLLIILPVVLSSPLHTQYNVIIIHL